MLFDCVTSTKKLQVPLTYKCKQMKNVSFSSLGNLIADGVFSHWQIHLDRGRLFLPSLGSTFNSTSTTEQHVHHFTSLLKVLLDSICERGRELLLCVSGMYLQYIVDALEFVFVCLFFVCLGMC